MHVLQNFWCFLHQYMYWYIGDIINLTKLSNLHNVSDGEKSMESKISSQNIIYVRNFHGFFFQSYNSYIFDVSVNSPMTLTRLQ